MGGRGKKGAVIYSPYILWVTGQNLRNLIRDIHESQPLSDWSSLSSSNDIPVGLRS